MPFIANLTPAAHRELNVGRSMQIAFDAQPGLRATFELLAPLTNLAGEEGAGTSADLTGDIITTLPMMETTPGHYVGYYTAPLAETLTVAGAAISVRAVNTEGLGITALAPGQVWVNTPLDTDVPPPVTDEGLIISDRYPITNLTPTVDRRLVTGKTLMVEFDSVAGLNAYFELKSPLLYVEGEARGLAQADPTAGNANKLPMMEVTPGHYVGYFTIPSNLSLAGAAVQVTVYDAARYATQATAAGKLWINVVSSE
jgi:hypothetical protein